MCKINFGGNELANISTIDDLLLSIESISKDFRTKNPVVEFVHSNGNVLLMGFSEEGCFLNFQDGTYRPLFYSSTNPSKTDDGKLILFSLSNRNHYIELNRTSLVNKDDLIKVAAYFLKEGDRAKELIHWKLD